MSFFLFLQNKFTANKLLIFSFLKYVIKIGEIPPNNIFGVPRQLAGRALHCNLFYFAYRRIKKGFTFQSLTQPELKRIISINNYEFIRTLDSTYDQKL